MCVPILVDLLIILVAAKVAEELAGRVGIPGVVAEIAAGVLIGSSVLGWVGEGEVLTALGELGVIVLLLEVGLEMDARELRAVGRSAATVAVIGVVAPFAGGWAVATALGHGGHPAVFLGAALTATSVGITARVFNDLRALASVEARVVLGAAVVDDVLGLVILTVVVRIVTEGSVDAATVLGVIAAATAFLAGGAVFGAPIARRWFGAVARHGRGAGTLLVAGVTFGLAFAALADAARLAPIVGAFLAGLALGTSPAADRFRREVRPLAHVLVPVFFVAIGLAIDVRSFADTGVLALAAALTAVAVMGKLLAATGAGPRIDRLTVGLGMMPRGEVGLIFATLGRQSGVLGADLYAALVLVILLTTVITPPLLRVRLMARTPRHRPAAAVVPDGGWLAVEGGAVELRDVPSPAASLGVALAAALAAATASPGPRLLDWLGSNPIEVAVWDHAATRDLLALLRADSPRSWRLLHISGVLEAALPEVAAAVQRRADDIVVLDPAAAWRWPVVQRLHQVAATDGRAAAEFARLDRPELLLLAALVLDAAEGSGTAPRATAAAITGRLDLDPSAEAAIAAAVTDHASLAAAARQPGGPSPRLGGELAAHVGTREQLRAAYLLALAAAPFEEWSRAHLDALVDEVGARVDRVEAAGGVESVVELHRLDALAAAPTPAVARRVAATPRTHLVGCPPDAVARHAALVDRALSSVHDVEVGVLPAASATTWIIDVAARDRPGLLAAVAAALLDAGIDVIDAVATTWPDGGAIESFLVRSERAPDSTALAMTAEAQLRRPINSLPLPGAALTFDNTSSPWHTTLVVEASDRRGVLRAVASAIAAAGATVHAAHVETAGGTACDRFDVSRRDGSKLTDADCEAVRRALDAGTVRRRKLLAR